MLLTAEPSLQPIDFVFNSANKKKTKLYTRVGILLSVSALTEQWQEQKKNVFKVRRVIKSDSSQKHR